MTTTTDTTNIDTATALLPPPPVMFDGANYMRKLHIPGGLQGAIDDLADMITSSGLEYDFLACRGTSGLIVTPALSMKLGTRFTYIRKQSEDSHVPRTTLEGWVGGGSYIIIDDLIDSGATVVCIHSSLFAYRQQRIRLARFEDSITLEVPAPSVPVAVALYKFSCKQHYEFTDLLNGRKFDVPVFSYKMD